MSNDVRGLIEWHVCRRFLNQTWTNQQKKSALKEKNAEENHTCGGKPGLQQPQRATGTLYMHSGLHLSVGLSFFIVMAFCLRTFLWHSQLFFSSHQGKPAQAKIYEESKNKSKRYWEKDPRSVNQHAHEGGAHQRAWANWCVSIMSYFVFCSLLSEELLKSLDLLVYWRKYEKLYNQNVLQLPEASLEIQRWQWQEDCND